MPAARSSHAWYRVPCTIILCCRFTAPSCSLAPPPRAAAAVTQEARSLAIATPIHCRHPQCTCCERRLIIYNQQALRKVFCLESCNLSFHFHHRSAVQHAPVVRPPPARSLSLPSHHSLRCRRELRPQPSRARAAATTQLDLGADVKVILTPPCMIALYGDWRTTNKTCTRS